jgi:hypothetical protein
VDFSLYRTEHISKYRSIEKFMKLPFQRVVIHQKWSWNEGAMSVLLQRCVLSKTDFRTCCTRWFSHNCLYEPPIVSILDLLEL